MLYKKKNGICRVTCAMILLKQKKLAVIRITKRNRRFWLTYNCAVIARIRGWNCIGPSRLSNEAHGHLTQRIHKLNEIQGVTTVISTCLKDAVGTILGRAHAVQVIDVSR